MSDSWLSKIEIVDKEGRDEFVLKNGYEPPENATEQTARVIRELAKVVKIANKVPVDAMEEVHLQGELHEAIDNLSPDAKELL